MVLTTAGVAACSCAAESARVRPHAWCVPRRGADVGIQAADSQCNAGALHHASVMCNQVVVVVEQGNLSKDGNAKGSGNPHARGPIAKCSVSVFCIKKGA
jgi:hypothetical protein